MTDTKKAPRLKDANKVKSWYKGKNSISSQLKMF
jgi:hypothetical protein